MLRSFGRVTLETDDAIVTLGGKIKGMDSWILNNRPNKASFLPVNRRKCLDLYEIYFFSSDRKYLAFELVTISRSVFLL